MNDLLTRHLLDLVNKAPADTFVVGGGFGLNLKRSDLIQSGARTLLSELPEARVTTDIDLFLNLEVFIQPTQGQALRAVLNELGYTERTPKWQFEKPLDLPVSDQMLVLDLLARRPEGGDGVRVQSLRVGKEPVPGSTVVKAPKLSRWRGVLFRWPFGWGQPSWPSAGASSVCLDQHEGARGTRLAAL